MYIWMDGEVNGDMICGGISIHIMFVTVASFLFISDRQREG